MEHLQSIPQLAKEDIDIYIKDVHKELVSDTTTRILDYFYDKDFQVINQTRGTSPVNMVSVTDGFSLVYDMTRDPGNVKHIETIMPNSYKFLERCYNRGNGFFNYIPGDDDLQLSTTFCGFLALDRYLKAKDGLEKPELAEIEPVKNLKITVKTLEGLKRPPNGKLSR